MVLGAFLVCVVVGAVSMRRRKSPFGLYPSSLGNALQAIQAITQPRAEHAMVQMADDEIEDDSGDSVSAHLMRQAMRIRNGSFSGRLTAVLGRDRWGARIGGTLAVMLLVLGMWLPTEAQKAAVPAIDGAWVGTLDAGAMKLRVVFHLVTTDAGLTATMDSPDQGVKGIVVSSAVRTGDAVKLEVAAAHGGFTGTVSKDLATMTGTWSQGGNELPLVLTRAKDEAAAERVRPQNPLKPYPYREEEVSYANTVQGDTLAGTLTIPEGKGPFTAVLLITGSGPQDRDETLLGHKPFLVLSDYLTRKGIEVLRVDDRGVGQSTGKFAGATTADFATDVEAGIAFLKTRPEVKKIGLIGHSEGAMIAPMVAARNKDVAFIVMLAGTGVRGDKLIAEQAKLIAEAMGAPKDAAEAQEARQLDLYAMVIADKALDDAALKLAVIAKMTETEKGATPAQIEAGAAQIANPWFRYFLAYDPGPALRAVRCPVLALGGSKDLQVPVAQNFPAIRAALAEDKSVEMVELPGLNHLFQTAKTGSPTEYGEIEETIAPVVLEKVAGFVRAQ